MLEGIRTDLEDMKNEHEKVIMELKNENVEKHKALQDMKEEMKGQLANCVDYTQVET